MSISQWVVKRWDDLENKMGFHRLQNLHIFCIYEHFQRGLTLRGCSSQTTWTHGVNIFHLVPRGTLCDHWFGQNKACKKNWDVCCGGRIIDSIPVYIAFFAVGNLQQWDILSTNESMLLLWSKEPQGMNLWNGLFKCKQNMKIFVLGSHL